MAIVEAAAKDVTLFITAFLAAVDITVHCHHGALVKVRTNLKQNLKLTHATKKVWLEDMSETVDSKDDYMSISLLQV